MESLEAIMQQVVEKNPNETEFHQAVHEVFESIVPFVEKNPKYQQDEILKRLTEPDRIISFRVLWEDDNGNVQQNRGYRVQFNQAIGIYKGGLRFHPSVNLSILKFLAFEQTFKNSLTTLPIGGAKGGSDFDPKGKSDREIMRFCQAFMSQLEPHIGARKDVPAGDIGVGGREIGYLFGQYKRLRGEMTGVLTGKPLSIGGIAARSEATGYGTVFFMKEMLSHHDNQSIACKTCVISGSGNVAIFCAEKLLELGGKVISLSDSSGYIHDPEGLNREKIEYLKELKFEKHGRLTEFAQKYGCDYIEGEKPWGLSCDLAFPCATQNELGEDDAKALVKNGCIAVAEGANMPSTIEAVKVFHDNDVLFGPGKAANAGGVAVSCLEMSQNSDHIPWSHEEVENKLHDIMCDIHEQCAKHGSGKGKVTDYVQGANIAGFIKVADAMLEQGII